MGNRTGGKLKQALKEAADHRRATQPPFSSRTLCSGHWLAAGRPDMGGQGGEGSRELLTTAGEASGSPGS